MTNWTNNDLKNTTQIKCIKEVIQKSFKFGNFFNFLQGNITDQGRLLMQGSFNVFTEHQRGRIKDLRFKPMHRHMFLYEKSILLCKKKEESPTGLEKGVYVFKNLLQVRLPCITGVHFFVGRGGG